jgi:diacylglycerol kinase family enzyme
MGFDSAVCEETNRSTFKKAFNRIGLGKLAYLAIAVKQLLMAKVVSCKITMDDKPSLTIPNFLFAANMIHRYEGGGFMFCPGADSSDGIIDLCSATNKLPKACLLFVLPTAFLGKHYLFPGIRAHSGQEIHIKTTDPLWIHTDGEVLRYDTEMSVTCLKQALQLRY